MGQDVTGDYDKVIHPPREDTGTYPILENVAKKVRRDRDLMDVEQLHAFLNAGNWEGCNRPSKWLSMLSGCIEQCAKVVSFTLDDAERTGIPALSETFGPELLEACKSEILSTSIHDS
eukprot:s1108_g11.t1